jgi:hypothetical protein
MPTVKPTTEALPGHDAPHRSNTSPPTVETTSTSPGSDVRRLDESSVSSRSRGRRWGDDDRPSAPPAVAITVALAARLS